jgi:hypothetical protein
VSSATIRRGRDERTGKGANKKAAGQYVSFMPGKQTDEGETPAEPRNALDDHEETARDQGGDQDADKSDDDEG